MKTSDKPTSKPLMQFPSNATSSTHWQGKLILAFCDRQGETLLSHSFVQTPLKVQRPFYPEGPEVCHVVMLHTAGGIVGGDRLSTTICLEADTHALLTTATAGKIYRSNGKEAQQTVHVSLAAGACLEWLPQETIVFDGAQFRQNLRIELEPGALWMGWEIARLGRSARGEQFASGTWRSRTEVWQAGKLIWIDPQWIAGGSEMMHSPHGLASFPVIASFALVGREISPELVEVVRSLGLPIQEAEQRQSTSAITSPATHVGVTRLVSGLLCRYRGRSTQEARHWLTAVWNLMRQELLNRPGYTPRVW